MEPTPLALVIEDNEDQNLIFTTALQKAGYQTESILNGLEAKQRLDEIVPALVLLDLHMPGLNGDAILRQIRTEARLKHMRVILATADAEFASSLQSDSDLVLLKPISFSQLTLLAARLLNSSHAPD